jgi:hypothetical protein
VTHLGHHLSRTLNQSAQVGGMEPDDLFARATRGLRRPSLNARRRRSFSPHPRERTSELGRARNSCDHLLPREAARSECAPQCAQKDIWLLLKQREKLGRSAGCAQRKQLAYPLLKKSSTAKLRK